MKRKGRFFPFGAVVWADDGATQVAAAPADRADANDPASLLDRLVDELRKDAADGRIRAAATCVDVRDDPDVGTAIRADIEGASGETSTALLGYTKRFPRRFELAADVIERPGLRRIF